jgi:hypothetical protein
MPTVIFVSKDLYEKKAFLLKKCKKLAETYSTYSARRGPQPRELARDSETLLPE